MSPLKNYQKNLHRVIFCLVSRFPFRQIRKQTDKVSRMVWILSDADNLCNRVDLMSAKSVCLLSQERILRFHFFFMFKYYVW